MEGYDINLDSFKNNSPLIKATIDFFEQLNIYVTPVTEQVSVDAKKFLDSQNIQNEIIDKFFGPDGKCLETYFVGMLNNKSLYKDDDHGNATLDDEIKNAKTQAQLSLNEYSLLMIFAVEAKDDPNKPLTKSEISMVCRAFNRAFAEGNPVVVMFRSGDRLTFSLCERTDYRRATFRGQKAGKVSMLRNISIQKPHSGHLRILWKIKQYKEKSKSKVITFNDLYLYWLNEVFAVNVLTDDFYREILNWYLWATGTFNADDQNIKPVVPDMKFPDVNYGIYTQDTEEGRYEVKKQCTHVIRLITRLIFVWFIKQKGLIDECLFDVDFLKNSVRGFNDQTDNQNYYNAILQNLFFASLNCKKEDRGWATSGHTGYTGDYGNDVKFKDDSHNSFFINNSKTQIENILKQIPYLNGGLFDCLDYLYDPLDDPLHKIKNARKGKKIYVDGFSQEKKRRTTVPDTFFFGYTDSTHKGIIDQIFDKYYFTIEENSTNIIDVALDPELLGHVFEELLSVYNPETGVTMRKATGSFYTPKEIVEYMVTQSVAQYLASKISDVPAADFLRLIEDEEISETVDSHRKEIVEAVIRCKIFDPACGSGAFPMGCLHVLNNIVSILDDDKNTFWKEIVINQTKEAHIKQAERFEKTFNQTEFEEAEKQITENFTNNLKYPNYLRKLYILEHCIYGSDIQRIAMQITKLRFFISLVVEQRDNDNIQTLPNLETKFTCANTLIDNPDPTKNANNFDDAFNKEFKQLISNLANQLKDHRSKIFNTPDRKKKLKLKEQDSILRNSIADETKKKIDQYRNSKIEKCKQEIANAQKAIDDLLAQPDDTRTEVYVEYNIFGDQEEKKRKISKRKDEIEKFRRIKADWERKLQLFADGGQFQPYQTYAERLCEWNPYDMSADNCSFFDAEWMFGIKDGFDVVIGNPPYISHDNIPNNIPCNSFQCFEPFADLYCYFYEKGINLLDQDGLLSFITSNSYLRANYGLPLRQMLRNNCSVVQIIDIEGTQIFGAAIVNTAICSFQKTKKKQIATIVNAEWLQDDFNTYVNDNKFNYQQNDFDLQPWTLVTPENLSIRRKIENAGNTLEKMNTKIRLGIATGDNNAFILNEEQKESLIFEDSKNAEIIKPIIRGQDIQRYCHSTSKYVLLTKNGIDVPKDYPTIYKYLDSFGDKFKKRGAKGQHWTNLRACAFFDDFQKEKIVWIELTDVGRFSLSIGEEYLLNSAYFLLPPEFYNAKFLLGILNSLVVRFYIKQIAATSGMGTLRWINNYVKLIPIPAATTAQQQPIIDLVDEILTKKKQNPSEDTTDLEGKIDKLVYELYGLTDEEIKVIEEK